MNMNSLRLLKCIHRPAIFKISSVKYVSQHPLKFLETQDMWRDRDGISKNYQLIYKAPMDNLLKYATTYLTISSVTVAAFGSYYGVFTFDPATINDPVIIGDSIVIANSGIEYLCYIGAFISFHVAVKILLSKYVIRLYQNGDDYIAIFRGHLFNSIKKHTFQLHEFRKLQQTLVVSWSDSRFALGKKQGILLYNYFKTPEYFNRLMYKNKPSKQNETE